MKNNRKRLLYVWKFEGVLWNIVRWRPNTKQSRGQPRQRWADEVEEDLRQRNDWSGKCGRSVKTGRSRGKLLL